MGNWRYFHHKWSVLGPVLLTARDPANVEGVRDLHWIQWFLVQASVLVIQPVVGNMPWCSWRMYVSRRTRDLFHTFGTTLIHRVQWRVSWAGGAGWCTKYVDEQTSGTHEFRRRSWYDFVVQDTKFRNCLPQTPNWKGIQHPIWWKVSPNMPQHSVRLPPPFLTEADLVMFNAVVSACAGATQWRRALEVLFRYMHLEAQWWRPITAGVGWAKWWSLPRGIHPRRPNNCRFWN